jgi:hypothetical protein
MEITAREAAAKSDFITFTPQSNSQAPTWSQVGVKRFDFKGGSGKRPRRPMSVAARPQLIARPGEENPQFHSAAI